MARTPNICDEAVLSHVGRVRSINEDSFGSFRTVLNAPDSEPDASVLRRKGRLYVLADGMGGHQGGAVASALAVRELCIAYYAARAADPPGSLRQAIAQANTAVYTAGREQAPAGRMGTTLVCAVIHEGTLTLAHVGDSRAYRLRDGQLSQLTADHDWITQQMQLHGLSRAEAQARARKRGASGTLLRAVGVQPAVEPDIASFDWCAGDLLLLSSDGLHTQVEQTAIATMLRENPAQAAAHRLIAAANRAGGVDNITVLLVQAAAAGSRTHAALMWRRALMSPARAGLACLMILTLAFVLSANRPAGVNDVTQLTGSSTTQPAVARAPTATIDAPAANAYAAARHAGGVCDCTPTAPASTDVPNVAGAEAPGSTQPPSITPTPLAPSATPTPWSPIWAPAPSTETSAPTYPAAPALPTSTPMLNNPPSHAGTTPPATATAAPKATLPAPTELSLTRTAPSSTPLPPSTALPSPTHTPEPDEPEPTALPPTPVRRPTATPAPVATPPAVTSTVAPTATSAPEPTDTPAPQPTNTPELIPSHTPAPEPKPTDPATTVPTEVPEPQPSGTPEPEPKPSDAPTDVPAPPSDSPSPAPTQQPTAQPGDPPPEEQPTAQPPMPTTETIVVQNPKAFPQQQWERRRFTMSVRR